MGCIGLKKVLLPNGGKALQRDDTEDRALGYKLWHRKLVGGTCDTKCYMLDVDTIEWRYRPSDGVSGEKRLEPVAVIEVTRIDDGNPNDSYLEAILHRYNTRDMQGEATRYVADKLGVNAYICLYKEGSDIEVSNWADKDSPPSKLKGKSIEFWMYNLTKRLGWKYFSEEEYRTFIENL